MIATQFDSVAGDGDGIAVKDLVTGDIPFGAEMQVRLPEGGYEIYNYIEEAYDEDIDDFIPGWADRLDNVATAKIAPGAAFWLSVPTTCNVNISGQVLSDASKEMSYNAEIFSMVGNAYPVAVNPNELDWKGLSFGDELQVRLDAGGYEIYNYIEEAYDETLDDFVPGWADRLDNFVTDAVLRAGRGAWLKPEKAVSVTWESPIE